MLLNNCYRLYHHIINDFVNNVLIKNNITDPFDVFWLYIELYENNYFSKDTELGVFKYTTASECLDNYTDYKNNNAELYSDNMRTDNYDIDYTGIFMVNGNGVCRHIGYMLTDIYKSLGYKAYNVSGRLFNLKTKQSTFTDLKGHTKKLCHLICGLEYNGKFIYLDPTQHAIPYEKERRNPENDLTVVRVNTNSYIMDNTCKLENIDEKDFTPFIAYPAMFNDETDRYAYYKNEEERKELFNKVKNDCESFRNRHLEDYELISKVLHLYCDRKNLIDKIKFYQKALELKKAYKNKIKTLN